MHAAQIEMLLQGQNGVHRARQILFIDAELNRSTPHLDPVGAVGQQWIDAQKDAGALADARGNARTHFNLGQRLDADAADA